MAGGTAARQKLFCIVPPAVPAAAIIITVFFFAAIGAQPESVGVCGGWCGWCGRHIRQGHGRGGGGSICCAAGGRVPCLHHAGMEETAYGVGIRKRAGCPLLFFLSYFRCAALPITCRPQGPLAEPAPWSKKYLIVWRGSSHACPVGAGNSRAVSDKAARKRGSAREGGDFAEPAQGRLSVGKNLQKPLNSFFWGCYGLFRGWGGLFRALPSPLRYHKRVFFTSFVRVQKLKVFAGWTDRIWSRIAVRTQKSPRSRGLSEIVDMDLSSINFPGRKEKFDVLLPGKGRLFKC